MCRQRNKAQRARRIGTRAAVPLRTDAPAVRRVKNPSQSRSAPPAHSCALVNTSSSRITPGARPARCFPLGMRTISVCPPQGDRYSVCCPQTARQSPQRARHARESAAQATPHRRTATPQRQNHRDPQPEAAAGLPTLHCVTNMARIQWTGLIPWPVPAALRAHQEVYIPLPPVQGTVTCSKEPSPHQARNLSACSSARGNETQVEMFLQGCLAFPGGACPLPMPVDTPKRRHSEQSRRRWNNPQ